MSELNNKENYKSEINDSLKDILHVYIRIVVDYLQFMIKKDNNPKKKQYFKFILLRGLETMTHIFNYLLFYEIFRSVPQPDPDNLIGSGSDQKVRIRADPDQQHWSCP